MKNILRLRVAIIAASVLLSIAGLTYLALANLTTPITVDVNYPGTTSGGTTVGGTGRQQVFRLGASTATGDFLGLEPKAGTCPAGSIAFLSPSINPASNFQASRSAIGVNDFVYAIKINNTMSNVPLTTELNGLCPGRVITSIGYCQNPPAKSPTDFVLLSTGLDFFFDGPQVIPIGESSTVLFYTSPDPPARQPTSIGSSGVSSNGEQPNVPENRTPIYGPCPTTLTIDKQIACSANGPFTDGPQTALAGAQVFYKITVKNTGMTPLDNVSITDVQLKAGGSGNITGDFTFPTTPGHLNPSQSVTQVFGPFTATTGSPVPGVSVNGTNTAIADAQYLIPDQTGIPSGQTFELSTSDQVVLNVVAPSLQCNKTVDPQSFNSFPATLTYHLKVTNTGGTDLATTIDDTKLRAIITTPPAGVTISAQIHVGAGFAPGTLAPGNNFPATFPVVNGTGGVNTMAQVDVSLTISTFAAFQLLHDDTVPPGSNTITNLMTAMGMVTNFTGCTTGGINTAQCNSQVVVMFIPPCMIMLEKTVACGTAPSAGDFAPTATALKNAAIVYRYKITNGQDAMNNVVIHDDKISSPFFNVGTLTPGQIKVIDVAATAPSAVGPLLNTATASGVCASSGQTMTSTQVNATVTVINPQVNCNKLVNGVTSVNNYVAGQTLTYTLTTSNAASSGTNLDLAVADPTLSGLPGVACKLADNSSVVLPHTFLNVTPGQSQTITCTVSFPTADAFKAAAGGLLTLNNTLSVTGTLPPGSTVCTTGAIPPSPFLCSSMASVTIIPKPTLVLTKEVACADPALNCTNGVFQTTTPANPLKLLRSADGTMTAAPQYRFRVTNTGDITINNININDDKLGSIPVGNLAPGASSSFICPAPLPPPLGVTTNTARAVGTSAMSTTANNVQSNEARATVEVQQPSLNCSITVSECKQLGDTVTVCLTLKNGPVPISVDTINGLPGVVFPAIIPLFEMAPFETKTICGTFIPTLATTAITVTVNGRVNTTGFCVVQANGNSVSSQIGTSCNITVTCGLLPKCETICFKTPSLCELLIPCCLPRGSILIGGLNFNNPIDIKTNIPAIKQALHPCAFPNCTLSPLQQLNQQYVAAQLSLLSAGGSVVTINVLWGTISCYGGALKNFPPVTLSNGTVIKPSSMLKELFMAADSAIRQNRTQDMVAIANIFKLLLGSTPGSCGPDGVGIKISSLDWNPLSWEPELFLLPRRILVS